MGCTRSGNTFLGEWRGLLICVAVENSVRSGSGLCATDETAITLFPLIFLNWL